MRVLVGAARNIFFFFGMIRNDGYMANTLCTTDLKDRDRLQARILLGS